MLCVFISSQALQAEVGVGGLIESWAFTWETINGRIGRRNWSRTPVGLLMVFTLDLPDGYF